MNKFGYWKNPFYFSKPRLFCSQSHRFFSSQASYYDILELDRKCTVIDIKKAYYKKVKIYHPDRNKDPKAEEHFKQIALAYETLKDPSKRYIYDLSEKNPQFREDFKSNDEYVYSDWREDSSSRKYYENKWYGYRKGTEKTMRDEYFDNRMKTHKKDNNDGFGILMLRLCFVVGLISGFELYKEKRNERHQSFRNLKREVFKEEGNVLIKDKNEAVLKDLEEYIRERQKANEEK